VTTAPPAKMIASHQVPPNPLGLSLTGGGSPVLQDGGAHNDLSDPVGVTVGRGSPVLQVPFLVLPHVARYTYACPTVCHARGEVVNAARLMSASEASFVVLAVLRVVLSDVSVMLGGQLLYCCVYEPSHIDIRL